MNMNPESRKRAVEVMAREQAKNSEFGGMSDEPEFWVHDCERMLDALLAADSHVAEWRKEQARVQGGTVLKTVKHIPNATSG